MVCRDWLGDISPGGLPPKRWDPYGTSLSGGGISPTFYAQFTPNVITLNSRETLSKPYVDPYDPPMTAVFSQATVLSLRYVVSRTYPHSATAQAFSALPVYLSHLATTKRPGVLRFATNHRVMLHMIRRRVSCPYVDGRMVFGTNPPPGLASTRFTLRLKIRGSDVVLRSELSNKERPGVGT